PAWNAPCPPSPSSPSEFLPDLDLVRGCGADAAAGLLLAQHTLRIEVADAAALASGCGVDDCVDQCRLAGIQGRVDGALEFIGCRNVNAHATEGFHHLVVTRALDEHRRRRVRATCSVHVGSAIDAIVVEDDDADGQAVAADRFHFHAGETKG